MKNNKILISVLGRGKYDKTHKCHDYSLTHYKIEEHPSVESKLVSDILAREIAPGKIYILGTKESLWHVADDYLPHYEKIEIPYGTKASEFWEIFDAMTSLDVEGKEIYFDITHGFRSIPLFVSTILNFFENVKNAHIKGVYYGLFEARDQETNTTPVINMLPFLEMNDWIRAFDIFKKYSDGREISTLIHQKFSNIPNDEKKRVGKIQNIARELDFYSKAIGFSAVEFYHNTLQKIHRNIQNLEKGAPLPSQLRAAKFLLGSLSKEAGTFDTLQKKWEQYLCAAELLFEKNRYAQSLTILRETILTYFLEELGFDTEDLELREDHLSRVIKDDEELYKDQKVTRFLSSELILLFQNIRELRNKSNHAFIKKSIGKKDVKKSVENLKSYLKGTKDLFENDKAFIDKEGLKAYLTVRQKGERDTFSLNIEHKTAHDIATSLNEVKKGKTNA